jgi:hypothetical protein
LWEKNKINISQERSFWLPIHGEFIMMGSDKLHYYDVGGIKDKDI